MILYWKNLCRRVGLLLFFFYAKAADGQGKIMVNISNIESDKGVCKTCLFTDEVSFAGKGSALKCADVKIRNKRAIHVFDGVPPGIYAIAVFHDQNVNNKMDKNFLGIPKEGYGASKNKLPFASAPSFRENQFEVVAGSININIRLRNL